ncbi:MAG: hypothetical protein E7337_00895 [Clostridiales bacterium]|nr:hypothetical protein [Clostridiales bacterium]
MRFIKSVALILLALCLSCACAETGTVYKVGNIPYYHADAACSFGGFSLKSGFEDAERVEIESEVAAEGMNLRPCPSCTTEFKPVFTGTFPEWNHDVDPWDFGDMNTHLSKSDRKDWGNVADTIWEIVGEGPYPEDYAGIFYNACGGYTIMMVDPTPERIEKYRKTLKGEFWVMEATFSLNYLRALQDELINIMGFDGLTINSLGSSMDGNCVVIGANDTSDEALAAIHAYMAMKGFDDPRAVVLEYAEPAHTVDF